MWTDNPVLDAERYAAKEEEQKYIICDCCGQKIFCEDSCYEGEEYYRIEEQNVCQNCIRDFLNERKVSA